MVQEPHIPNQELIEPVGHSWSACDDGLITPTIHNNAPVEVRNLTHHDCTERECVDAKDDAKYVTQDNKPEVDDETELDTQTAQSNHNNRT